MAYPPEPRGYVDLLEEGRSIAQVAHGLDMSQESIYAWRRQLRIDRGLALADQRGKGRTDCVTQPHRRAGYRAEGRSPCRGPAAGNQSPKSRFAAAEMTVAEGAPTRFALCAICAA